MASGDLTTLANVKQWVNVTNSTDDSLLTRLITSVSNFMQSWLNRQLTSTAYADAYDGADTDTVMIPNYPVTAVASVVVDNIPIPASTDPTTPGWTFDQYSVRLIGGYRFSRGRSNVVINYTAGYSTMPVEIEQACIELVSLRYAERLRPGVTSRSIGGENISYSSAGISDSVSELLQQYKKVVPI